MMDEDGVPAMTDGTMNDPDDMVPAGGAGLAVHLLEGITDALIALDRDWRFLYVNARAGELFGRDAHALVGRHIWTEYPEGVGQPFHRAFERVMTTRRPEVIEEHYASWDRWFENRIYPVPQGLAVLFTDVTARKRAQAVEQRRDMRLRRLIDELPVGAVYCERERLFVNPAMERITGWSRADLATLDDWFRVLFDDPAHMRALYEADLDAGFPERRLLTLRHRDGGERQAEFCAVDGGDFAVWVMTDLTGRREADALIRRQALLVETLRDAVIICDADFRVVEWNAAAERLFGWSREEVLGQDPALLHDPDLGGQREHEIREALAREGRFVGEMPFMRKDGSRGIADLVVVPQVDEQGRLIGSVAVHRDATERVRADAALRASERRFRALIEGASDPIAVMRPDHVVTYASPAYARVIGRAPEAIVGRDGFECVHPDDARAVVARFARVVHDAGSTDSAEYRIHHADGSWRTVAVVARNLLDDPAVRGVVINSRDVTEQRALEAQLRHAQKMEAIGRLAGGIAHDFNNLLTVIRTYAELVHAGLAKDDPRRTDLGEVLGAATRASALTRQLLAFGRRTQLPHVRGIDVNEVVRGMELMLRRVVGERIQLAISPGAGVGAAVIDPSQLEQVLMNLATNARDAMPSGGVLGVETAAVTVGPVDPGRHAELSALPVAGERAGEYVVLRVSDTGVGMDESVLAHVFEPFFTTKPPGQGTGLGLATVYGTVTAIGGHVRVRSAPGHGTTLEVFLPREAHDTVSSGIVGLAAPSPGGSETILVVEDEASVRLAVRRILERAGYEVREARHGADALRLWQADPGAIDLVLTDIVMPEMSGTELASALRRDRPETRVLFMSGYTGGTIDAQAIESTEQLIAKPFEAETLLRRVRDALDRKASPLP